MLMQAIDDPHTGQLPPQAVKLLQILKAHRGVWLTRSDVAGALNKRRLNPGETALLDMLAALGEIEVQRVNDQTPMGYHWEYRAIAREG